MLQIAVIKEFRIAVLIAPLQKHFVRRRGIYRQHEAMNCPLQTGFDYLRYIDRFERIRRGDYYESTVLQPPYYR
jgi:hypothetical protein